MFSFRCETVALSTAIGFAADRAHDCAQQTSRDLESQDAFDVFDVFRVLSPSAGSLSYPIVNLLVVGQLRLCLSTSADVLAASSGGMSCLISDLDLVHRTVIIVVTSMLNEFNY